MSAARKSTPPPALPPTDESGPQLRLVPPPPVATLPRKATGTGTRPAVKLSPIPDHWLKDAENEAEIELGPLRRETCRTWKKPCALTQCRYNSVSGAPPRLRLPFGICTQNLSDAGPQSVETVAEVMGLRRSRILQIEANALRKLGRSDAGRRLLEAFGLLKQGGSK